MLLFSIFKLSRDQNSLFASAMEHVTDCFMQIWRIQLLDIWHYLVYIGSPDFFYRYFRTLGPWVIGPHSYKCSSVQKTRTAMFVNVFSANFLEKTIWVVFLEIMEHTFPKLLVIDVNQNSKQRIIANRLSYNVLTLLEELVIRMTPNLKFWTRHVWTLWENSF